MFAIYQIIHKLNGKSYVGFTSESAEKRWRRHQGLSRRGSLTHFHSSIRKYGSENFKLEVLEEGWDSKIGKDIREPYWISVLKPEYNHTKGGDGALGYRHTEEWKQKKAQQVLGTFHTTDTKLRMADSQKKHWEKNDERKKDLIKSMFGNDRALGSKHTELWKSEHRKRMTGNTYTLGKSLRRI